MIFLDKADLNKEAMVVYKVCGFTNYDCNCGSEQIFGDELNLSDAMSLFVTLTKNMSSLDFAELDEMIDKWALEFEWEDEDYYSCSYGGSIVLQEKAVKSADFNRDVVSFRIERDPVKKENICCNIEFGIEITVEEKDKYGLNY